MPKQKKTVTPPAPPPEPSLTDEYDLGEESQFDEELDSVPTRQAPPQDPATGRFVAPSQAASVKLQRTALQLGLSQAQIEQMSVDDLEDEVLYRSRHLTELAAEARKQSGVTTPTPPTPVARAPEPEPEEEEFALQDGGVLDPEVAKLFKQAMAPVLKRLKAAEGRVQELTQHEERRQFETNVEVLDRFFADHADLFGKGRRHELKPESPEMARRMAFIQALGQPKGNLRDHAETVFTTLYPDRTPQAEEPEEPEPTRNGSRITPEQWVNGGLPRPTQRVTQEPKGPRRAAKAVADKMRDLNLDDEAGDDNLPD